MIDHFLPYWLTMYVDSGMIACRPCGVSRKLFALQLWLVKASAAQPVDDRYATPSRGASGSTPRHSLLSTPPTSTSTPCCWTSCWASVTASVGCAWGSAYTTCSGWPWMPPEALIWATARSVFARISAPSTAVSGALSSSTPILMGVPLACLPDPPPEAPPPHAASATTPAAVTAVRHHLRRPSRPPALPLTAAPPPGFSPV